MSDRLSAMTKKMVTCSNPVCVYFGKEAEFRPLEMVKIVTDRLRPGEFAPMPFGAKFFCIDCGWVFSPEAAEGKGGTISPVDDPTPGSFKKDEFSL